MDFFDNLQVYFGWVGIAVLVVEGIRRVRRLLQKAPRLSRSATTVAIRCSVIGVAAGVAVVFLFVPSVHSTDVKIGLALLLVSLGALEIWAEISDHRHQAEAPLVIPASKPRRSALAQAAGRSEPSQARMLIRRGEDLLAEIKRLRTPVDPHTARYQPEVPLSKNMARKSRYWMIGSPPKTGSWLADVSRFVSEHAHTHSAELYPGPVRSLETEQAAIERSLTLLRRIDDRVAESNPLPALIALRQEGLDLLNAAIRERGLDEESLLERAVESWTSKVRDRLKSEYPDWAFAHFVAKPVGARSPRATLQVRVQRLNQIILKIESGETR